VKIVFLPKPTSQPTGRPSVRPTTQPSRQPTLQPSSRPTCPSSQPTTQPTSRPSRCPSRQPTNQPTSQPFGVPSTVPSGKPSSQPSGRPSRQPINCPTNQPSTKPSSQPTRKPTTQPTLHPFGSPSAQPTSFPSSQPSDCPSVQPTGIPSGQPTSQPTGQPFGDPSAQPSTEPSSQPSSCPTQQPSSYPSTQPTTIPSAEPSNIPSSQPLSVPTNQPTNSPSSVPSAQPSSQPTGYPSAQPTLSPTIQPSSNPTDQPSARPSIQPSSQPTNKPSGAPTRQPTSFPSSEPSNIPTVQPSTFPSSQPSSFPSSQPTHSPSDQPTNQPTSNPSDQPTVSPSTQPSSYPSSQPSRRPSCTPTMQPSSKPTGQPTGFPTSQPSVRPSTQPTGIPSTQPSAHPSRQPTNQPSNQPTNKPSSQPSSCPSTQPTRIPSCQPTVIPSDQPTSAPTDQPSSFPTCHPTNQPSNRPSKQPISSPTSRPSNQPTTIPTAQPFAFPTSAPQATIYQTNGVLFYLGTTSATNKTYQSTDVLGSSYILFGRNFKHQRRFPFTVSLDASQDREFISKIAANNDVGIRNDIATRSSTIIGDINGDTYLDLLVGYPLASKCYVYLGDGVNDFATIITTTGESFAIIGDPYQGGGFLGWSSIRIGDLNGDGLEEIVVSAIYANIIYVIYGRKQFDKTVNINGLTNENGFQIKGSDQDTNFGVGLSLLHHFHKGSHADIAITAQRSTGGQCIIYVLFGGVLFENPDRIIAIDRFTDNPSVLLKIIAPLYSFAGFSVAGIGDINSDGYDDLAIGSVPYDRGKYSEQKTYIIYGRKFVANEAILELSQMTSEDGFIINGGGFLVTGVGDVNADNVADVMICSYYDWKGQNSAYLISAPSNITYLPSLQPSSTPTMTPTISSSYSPALNVTRDNSTFSLTKIPSFRPSNVPTKFNSTLTPTRAVFAVGTSRPVTGKPFLAPSLTPTFGYHRLRGFPTSSPALASSLMPTINITSFTEIDCPSGKEYQGQNRTHNLFRITANKGVVKLLGSEEGGAKNVYVLNCPSDRVDVAIQNFRISSDIINLAHLVQAGYFYPSLKDISYSKSDPLTLLFCSENKLQVILSSHSLFDLLESNFLFTEVNENAWNQQKKKNTEFEVIQIGVVGAILAFVLTIFLVLAYQKKQEDKEKLLHEERWFHSLKTPNEELHIYPVSDHGVNDQENQQILNYPVPSTPSLVENINIGQEIVENTKSLKSLSSRGSSSSSISSVDIEPVCLSQSATRKDVATMNSDDWLDALACSDGDGDDEQQLHEQSVSWVALSGDNIVLLDEMCPNHQSSDGSSSSSSSTSSCEEGSQLGSEKSFSMNIVMNSGDLIEENGTNRNNEDSHTINSDEWQDALAFSEDEDCMM
jgi:hypothetical protein